MYRCKIHNGQIQRYSNFVQSKGKPTEFPSNVVKPRNPQKSQKPRPAVCYCKRYAYSRRMESR